MTSILILQHQRPDGEVDTYHLKAGRRYHLGRGSQCQVRILDLKLSRQHCAFEWLDGKWQLVDLASTNGCQVDGERVNGSQPLRRGAVVVAGNTSVLVERVYDSSGNSEAESGEAAEDWPKQPESEPVRASDRLAAAAARSADHRDDLEPQPAPDRAKQSDPLIPGLPAMPEQASQTQPTPDHDVLVTLQPGHPALPGALPPASTAPGEPASRTFYINVLGRRVGPLSRTQARELKSKELKGSLTPADLAAVEAEASLGPVPAAPAGMASSDDQHTYYVTLLGQRVGPLTRHQARELKSLELRGILTLDEVRRVQQTEP